MGKSKPSKDSKAGGSSADASGGGAGKVKGASQVHIRHILCEKQSKALEALEKIKAGQPFATVAATHSEDKARQGGDLGWKRKQDVVGAFADAAFALDVGQMTPAPVKTEFGYHLILCEGRK